MLGGTENGGLQSAIQNQEQKLFRLPKSDDDLNPVNAVNKLWKELKKDDEDYTEDSANKSAALEAGPR